MKKFAVVIGLCALTALAGCTQDAANRDIYEESGNTVNVNNKRHELYNEGGTRDIRNVNNNFGYVRHQKSPLMNDKTANDHFTGIDREQVAHIISEYSTDIPNVNDVATLVTDTEVLVAYDTNSKNRNLTADQVKRTAMSVVPRYYHVYVTDNKVLMRDVENLANLDTTNRNAHNLVNQLITQMKKSPQGNPVNWNEDENGLTPDEK